jgi:hypothetical protein
MQDDAGLAKFLRTIERTELLIVDDREIAALAEKIDATPIRGANDESSSARFDLHGSVETIGALVVTLNLVWDYISHAYGIGKTVVEFLKDADATLVIALDHNEKLALVERIIRLLRSLGLSSAADRVEAWVNAILDKITRPR